MKTKQSSIVVGIVLSVLFFKACAFAGTDVWTGGGGSANLFWLSTANWNPAQIPQTGDTLIFTNAVGLINSNNIPSGTFNGITFATPAGAFVLNGNSVTLANITDLQVVTPEIINLPITDNGPANLNANVTANGVLNVNNIISGTGNLTNSGAGRINVNGSNTFTGSLVINGGVVTVSQETNLPVAPIAPAPGNIIINGGTLQALAGFTISSNRGISVGPSSGSGQGTISVNTEASTPNQYATLLYGGSIANNGGGTGGLTKLGFGNVVLSGTSTYTGTTSNEVGTLTLDFSKPGAPVDNIISSNSPLVFGGSISGAGVTNFAQLVIMNSAAGTISQTFNGTHVTVGSAIIRVASGSGTANLTLGALDHDAGGVLAIMPPTLRGGSGSVSTTSTNLNGIIGGWATISDGNTVLAGWTASTNWACIDVNSNIVNYANFTIYSSGYVSGIMAYSNNILIPSTATGTLVVAADQTNATYATYDVNTITFDRADSGWTFQIGVSNILRLGTSGGLLRRTYGTSTSLNFGTAGTGELTAGGPNMDTPGDIVLTTYQTDSANNNVALISPIVDNGAGAVTMVKAGSGYASLNGVNSYSGGTYIEGGRLRWNGGSFGSGPIYIFPGGYTYVNGGTVITNAWFLSGNGSQQEAGLGALRYGPGPNSGSYFTGPITLIGDTEIGGQGSGAIVGPVSGPFKLILGCLASATGDTTLANTNNSWSGDTLLTARNNAGVNTLTLSNSEVIPNGFGKGNVSMQGFSTGQIQWKLNGFNETINGLSLAPGSVGASCIISNGAASTTSTLTLGDNDQSGTFGGFLKAGSGILALTKIGAGIETLTAANTYSGATTISNGVLQLSGGGSINNSTSINIYGGTFDVSAAPYTVPSAQTINMSGGTWFINNASSLNSPVNITNGTLKVAGSLNTTTPNLSASIINLSGGANVIQPLVMPLIDAYPKAFVIVGYTTLNGSVSALSASLPSGGFPPYGGFISNDTANKQIDLVMTNGPITPSLTWLGYSGGSPNSTWNFVINDWTNKPARILASYSDGSLVTFDDSGLTNVVNLTTTFAPAGVTVTNSNVYTLVGVGGISGTNGVTKLGSGMLVLDNTGGDSYSGGLNIGNGSTVQLGANDLGGSLGAPNNAIGNNGLLVFDRVNSLLVITNPISGTGSLSDIGTNGTLQLAGANSFGGTVTIPGNIILQAGNNTALGTSNGPTLIAYGGSLDVNGFNLGGERVTIGGIGVTNVSDGTTNGAIYNSSPATASPALAFVTLTGDTVFGGAVDWAGTIPSSLSNRWDLRAPGGTTGDPTTAGLSTGGNAYNLTKISPNLVGIVSATVDPKLANIDIQGGLLDIEGNTTGLGDPTKTLTVENGATLFVYSATNQFNKNIVLNGNGFNNSLGTLNSGNGNNTIVGPMLLNGNVEVTFRTPQGGSTGGSLTLNNTITGTSSLTKEDTNTLTVAGVDNHTGGTVVNDGTFILNGINSNTANTLTVNSHSLTIPAILGGNGTNSGMVTINDTLWPGAGGTPGTFGTKYLTFNGALNAYFSLGSQTTVGSRVNDLLNVGVFDPEGSVVFINPMGPLATGNTYTLVNYTSTTGSTFGNVPQVIPADQPSRYAFSVQQTAGNGPGTVKLTVTTGTGVMRWTGIANDTSTVSNIWDLADVQTWTNTATASPLSPQDYQFEQGDAVLFDDLIASNGGTNVVVIRTNNPNGSASSPVLPSSITVSNTLVTNYTFTSAGGGSIAGTLTLTKTGTGSLTISEANTYSGTITINGGRLIANNDTALGSYNTVIIVTNTGALDVGGASLGANNTNVVAERLVEIAGLGPGNGEGTLINSSANPQEDSMQNVLMTADASIGCNGLINGAGRFDIGRLSPATFSTGGHAYNLTKVGTNEISFVNLTVDTNLANIDIQGGELGYETGTTGLGNPTNTLTIESGALLELFEATNALNKVIIVNGGGLAQGVYPNIDFNGGGLPNNSIIGSVKITNGLVVVGGGASGSISNVINGPGALEIAGPVYLSATNTYTGNTVVSNNGTLFLTGSGSINNSTNLFLLGPGAKVDVSGLGNNGVLVLGGQTLTGNGVINGSLSNAVGSTVIISSTNASDKLTVTNNAYLAGTTVMKLDGNQTNDVLAVSDNITYGGTLTLTNTSGSPLALGNTWKLFNATTYSASSFSSISPVNPNNDPTLAWDTSQLTITGAIGVMSASTGPGTFTNQPGQLRITFNGANVSIAGTNGQSGDAYYLLMSTNVALPKNLWQTVATNVLSADGNFTFTGTNVVAAGGQQQFYLLSNTNAIH